MQAFLDALRKLIEELAPALAVMLYDYEESKVDSAKNDARDAEVKLDLEKNHESVDQKYSGKSDSDVLNDALSGGTGQPGKTDPTDKP